MSVRYPEKRKAFIQDLPIYKERERRKKREAFIQDLPIYKERERRKNAKHLFRIS